MGIGRWDKEYEKDRTGAEKHPERYDFLPLFSCGFLHAGFFAWIFVQMDFPSS